MRIFLDKSEKSICEIKKDNGYGTGFFCILRYPDKYNKIYCLITNYHVIDNDMLKYKEYLEIKMNNKEIKINLNRKRKIWRNEGIDYTCIEILKEDNIIENINPFDINDNCYNKNYDNEKYDKKGILITSIGLSKDIEISQGKIYFFNNKLYFYHDCNTEEGFSGGPIILINNLSIIGIHVGYEKNKKNNIGIYFSEIIRNINEYNHIKDKDRNENKENNENKERNENKDMNENKEINENKENNEYNEINENKDKNENKENNEIKCILYIDKNDYKQDILLFNNNDDNKYEFINNIKIYIGGNEINIKNEGNKWKIKYDFKKVGEYEIKINFNKKLKDINKLF